MKNPRTSQISVSLKVEEAGHRIYVDSTGMQLGSVSPVRVSMEEIGMFRDLFDFAISEWERAKQIESDANKKPEDMDAVTGASL